MVPTLETPRLTLRGHVPSDLTNSAAMWGDAAVTRYIGGRTQSREETWSRLLRYAGHWEWLGFGYWVVEEKETGAFVGEVGFADYQRNYVSAARDLPEAGWVLAPSAHGKGYATESVKALLAWGDSRFERTSCIIHPDVASIRVAEKCGFRELERTEYNGHGIVVFKRAACSSTPDKLPPECDVEAYCNPLP